MRLGPSKFSLMNAGTLQMTNDAFVAVTEMPKIYWEESHRLYVEKKVAEPDLAA